MTPNTLHPLIAQVNKIVPLLNGAKSTDTKLFLGAKLTKVHRYLITLYVAKHVQSFRLLGVKKGDSLCFTLYRLARIAATGFNSPIHYDRTKVAIRVYTKSEELGYVEIKKEQGDIFVTMTKEGDEICKIVLEELEQFSNIHSPTPVLRNEVLGKEIPGYISKGRPKRYKPSPYLRHIIYNNQLKITHKVNKQFGAAILALEE